jgi:hypothetical protein
MIHIFSDKDRKNKIYNKLNKKDMVEQSPSLNQGKKFKKYQSKIENSLEKQAKILSGKEGFSDMNSNSLTVQTINTINSNDYSNEEQTISDLRKELDKTLQEYDNLTEEISRNVNNYIDRVSQNNPYKNKTIKFTTGELCYVTNQGVVKYIPSTEIFKSLKVPKSSKEIINTNIPWKETYLTPGTIIPTTPSLISGTPVKKDQALGNEGSNVFVDQLLPSISEPEYMGCFAANENNDNMEFIGNKPPLLKSVLIQNGNFSQPVIQNNSYNYTTSGSIPGWYFGGAVLLNNSTAWGYPMPYPNGNQCVSIQNLTFINTILSLNSGVTYTLSFKACGRNCCRGTTTSNPINIELYTNLDAFISKIDNFTAPINYWTTYSFKFTVPTSQNYKLFFKGTNNSGDRSTALTGISLDLTPTIPGNISYDSCKQYAIIGGYRYFGLQNANTSSGLGYCAVSNSEPAISQYGTSEIVSKMIPLWSSNTAGNPDNTAVLTDSGLLQVLNSSGKPIYSSSASDDVQSTILSVVKPSKYFLIIEEDGNMSIYNGSDPIGKQGKVWSTNTAGKEQGVNANVIASKGKYGKNWMSSGSTLAPGDFIGSNDGKLALVMQSDGNLVLYTYETMTNCQKIGNKMGGGQGSNAVYDIGMVAIDKNMGKLAYIDDDSNLYTYPDNNEKFNDSYTKIENIQPFGSDILGAASRGLNVDVVSCEKSCNNNPDCGGFALLKTESGNVCYPQNSEMYPYGGKIATYKGMDTYIRGKQPSSLPLGVSSKTNNISTVDYQNYLNNGNVGTEYGLSNATSVQKQQLSQLQSKINMLSNEIKTLTNKFKTGTINVKEQSDKNLSTMNKNINELNEINNKIDVITEPTTTGIESMTNRDIENILKDSDIVVLQKNYKYLLWSILAAGTVLITMNISQRSSYYY